MTDDYKDKEPNEIALGILKKYQDAKLKEEKERKVWIRCIQFCNNWVDDELGQWETSVKKELGNKPSISFNEIRKYVNRICGAQRQTSVDEKAYPRDDQTDPMVAEILGDVIKYVKDLNRAELAIARMFRDGVLTGRGFIKTEFSDELDPLGEICVKSVNPMKIYVIGEGEKYDLTDRKGIIEIIPMDKDELLAQWPDKKEEIDGLARDAESGGDIPLSRDYDYGFGVNIVGTLVYNKDERKYQVLRYQKIEYRDANFIKNEQTGKLTLTELPADELKTAIDLASQPTMDNPAGTKHSKLKKRVKYVKVCTAIGTILLEEKDADWKFNGFDITGFFCYVDGGRITGVVQDLLDPQMEKNKRRSQALHILGTSAKNSYFVRKGAIPDIEKAKVEFGKVGGLIEVNGNPREAAVPIESNMTAVPALVQMDQAATSEMKEISGLHDAALGSMPEGATSGRAIQALQLPAETIIAEIYDNYINTRRILFTKVVALIQQHYTEERRIRILGDYSSKFIPPEIQAMKDQLKVQLLMMNPLIDEVQLQMQVDSMIQVGNGNMAVTVNKQFMDRKLNDITVGRFDIVIDQVSQNPSMRRQQYQDMVNLRSMGVPIPFDIIIKNSDIRGKDEILARLAEEEQKMMAMSMLMQKKPNGATPPQGGQSPPPANQDMQLNTAGSQF